MSYYPTGLATSPLLQWVIEHISKTEKGKDSDGNDVEIARVHWAATPHSIRDLPDGALQEF